MSSVTVELKSAIAPHIPTHIPTSSPSPEAMHGKRNLAEDRTTHKRATAAIGLFT